MPIRSRTEIINTPDRALRELERIAKAMKKGGSSVRVGLPKGSNAYPDGTSVIMVGAVHEFGSPKMGVPQRSYLRTTVIENRKKYKTLMAKLSKQIVDGNKTKKQALGLIGLKVQGDVQKKITDIDTPPLKDRDGNPLIDTGHLRQSITYEVPK